MIEFFRNNESVKYLIEKPDFEKLRELLTIAFKEGFKTPGRAIRRFMDIIELHKDEINGA